MRDWKKLLHGNRNQKKARVVILISDYIDFKVKTTTRNKEGHYIMIKRSIQEGDITIINIYVPKIGELQYLRQMLTTIKGEIDSNTIIVRGFDTPLTAKNRSFRQKINKETQASNDTLGHLDPIYI